MKRGLKAIFILFALVVNVECDIFGELLLTVKHIHDKVEKISNEQIRTNEKVDQLKTELQKNVDKIGIEQVNLSEKVDRLKSELHKKVDKISLQQVNTSEEVCQLKTKLNNLGLEINSKSESYCNEKFSSTTSSITLLKNEILEFKGKVDETNEVVIQKCEKHVELYEAKNKTFNQLKSLNLELSSKCESFCVEKLDATSSSINDLKNDLHKVAEKFDKYIEKIDEENEAILQKLVATTTTTTSTTSSTTSTTTTTSTTSPTTTTSEG